MTRSAARQRLRRGYTISCALFAVFILFTVLVSVAGVGKTPVKVVASNGQITPGEEISVGFAGINTAASDALGYSSTWYKLSKYLGYACILAAGALCLWAVWQAISRHGIRNMDRDLSCFCLLMIAMLLFYALFEVLKLNYRPVMLEGKLEASYPSTHTLIALCGAGGAAIFLSRMNIRGQLKIAGVCALGFVAFLTVLFRLLAGVHWVTDILGGVLLSAALVQLYRTLLSEKAPSASADKADG